MKNNFFKIIITCFVALAFNLSIAPVFSIKANELASPQEQSQNVDMFSELSEESMIMLFKAIEKIPDEMLERGNQYEIDRFMLENGIDLKFSGERAKRDFWGCVGAVSWAVGSTAVGVFKLAKVKKFVSASGGAYKAATNLIKMAKHGYSKANVKEFGYAMMNLGSEILGIKDIKDNCF
ncbi:hypothetical protein FAX13_08925 [Ligilactobacillus animalis]|nr:hypothetical protein FAX13_08925 [Ligilactobacillus animalis]